LEVEDEDRVTVILGFGLCNEWYSEWRVLQTDLKSYQPLFKLPRPSGTYLLLGRRTEDEGFGLGDSKHERLDLELRASEHDAREVDAKHPGELAVRDQPVRIIRPGSGSTYAFLVMISAASMISLYMTTLVKKYRSTRTACSGVFDFHRAVKLADE
jgi:hypothetical protein